jgi:hypothetical protein
MNDEDFADLGVEVNLLKVAYLKNKTDENLDAWLDAKDRFDRELERRQREHAKEDQERRKHDNNR